MSTPALSFSEHVAFLRRAWRNSQGFLLLLLGFTAVSTAVTIAYPLVFRRLLDAFEGRGGDLGHVLGVLGVIALGRVVAGFYPGVRAWVNQRIERDVRERLFGSILTKDHTFFRRFRTGDLVTRLTDDITDFPRIAWFACSGIFRFLDSASRFVFCVIAMLWLDPTLALLSLVPVPIMLYVFYLVRTALRTTYQQQQEAVARTNDVLEAAFSGIRIVKAFNAAPGQEARLADVLQERIRIQLRLAKLHVLVHQLDEAAGRVGQVIVMAVGGMRVLDGSLDLGTLYALYLYLDMLIHPMVDLPNLFVTARQAFVSIDRVEEVVRDPGIVQRTGTREGPNRIEDLRLEDVGFSYGEGRRAALAGVSLAVPRGAKVAVVGPVGAGKTTLLRILAGLVPVGEGRYLVNGGSFDEWRWPDVRPRIGYVPQDAHLFSDTIEDNVAFGREVDATDVGRALTAAQVAAEVSAMPQGRATRLGRGGTRISGGQRQRIAIARALAARPDLLLLDDCTASLDADNEERLWAALARECPDTTVVFVSHRPSTIRRADLVLALDAGRPSPGPGPDTRPPAAPAHGA